MQHHKREAGDGSADCSQDNLKHHSSEHPVLIKTLALDLLFHKRKFLFFLTFLFCHKILHNC